MATNLATIRVELIANAQRFKTNINKSQNSLKRFNKTAQKSTTWNKKLSNRFKDTSRSIAAIQGPLGPIAGRITSLGAIIGTTLNPVLLGAVLAMITLTVTIKKLVGASANLEKQQLKLAALIKATGGAAKQTGHDIEVMATQIGRATLASVQGARDAAGVLLTFKSIAGDVFERTLALTQDLAAVGFGSMKTAALQLGKALEEPEIGLSALRRVGVSFTEQQKEQIKVLSMTGNQLQAQQMILDALEGQVGGAGKGEAGGLAGAWDTLTENITLFFERADAGIAIVKALTNALKGLSNWIGGYIEELRDLPDTTEELNHLIELNTENILELSTEYTNLSAIQGEVNRNNIKEWIDRKKKLESIEKEISALYEHNKQAREKIELVKEEIVWVDKSQIIADKRTTKLKRDTERELELLGKSAKERRVILDLRKLEDKLISKLGEGETAQQKINDILVARAEAYKKNSEAAFELIELQEQIDKTADGIAKAFTSAGDEIVDAFLRGKQGALDFRNILRELIISIEKTIIKVLILDQIEKGIRAFSQDILGMILGTGKETGAHGRSRSQGGIKEHQTGGAIGSGQATLVGERGPELFVPRTAGSITPSSLTPGKLGGGQGVVINQNLNFAVGVTNTVRAEVMNMLPAIQGSTLAAVAEAKQRGGKFAKAFGG